MKIVTQPQARSPVQGALQGGQHTASRLLLDSYFISWFSREETQKLVRGEGGGAGGWARLGCFPAPAARCCRLGVACPGN